MSDKYVIKPVLTDISFVSYTWEIKAVAPDAVIYEFGFVRPEINGFTWLYESGRKPNAIELAGLAHFGIKEIRITNNSTFKSEVINLGELYDRQEKDSGHTA